MPSFQERVVWVDLLPLQLLKTQTQQYSNGTDTQIMTSILCLNLAQSN